MTKQYVLVLDVGTTNIKAFLFDVNGSIVGEAREKPSYIISEEGQVEQDPIQIWNMSRRVITNVLASNKCSAEHIVSMGITTQRASFLFWDKKTGKHYSNIITWQDKRAASYAKKKTGLLWLRFIRRIVGILCSIIPNTKLTTISILKFDSVHASSRTGYLLFKNPPLNDKVKHPATSVAWGTIDSWILWNLTGGKVHATDYSGASSTGILDPFTLKWNRIVRSIFKIPEYILPEIRETRGDFGSTTLFGRGEIPIRAMIADQQASLFGQLCFRYGEMKCTNGTGSFIDINTGNRPFASKRRLYPMVAWRVNGETTYMLEGQSQNTGNIIDWLKDELSLIKDHDESETLAIAVPSTNGVYFLPAFTSGLTFPYWDPTAKGNMFGISLDTKKAHIIRAVLEGLCFRIKDIVDGIKTDTKIKPTKIKVDGGVSKNKFLCQFLSDILGIEVEYFSHPEPTALGAAYMAGLAAGYWKSEEQLKSLMKKGTVYRPSIDEKERIKRYACWKNIIRRSLRYNVR
jgi:glycerol kinase